MLTKQQMAFLKVSLKIEDTDLPAPPKPDFVPRAKGEEYEDEHLKTGWRVANMKKKDTETEEEFQARKAEVEADDLYKTKHYTQEQTDAKRVTPDADGVMRDAQGNPAQGRNHIYAAELDTGDMILGDQYDHTKVDRGFDEDGKKKKDGTLTTHHTTMLRGEDVASAGTVSFKDGKITDISNISGHYKPQFEHLLQLVEHLLSHGALLDKSMVDHEGRDLKTTHPKAYNLQQKMQPVLAEFPADKKMIAQLSKQLDKKDFSEEQVPKVDAILETLKKKVAVVEKYFAAMRTMGVGPANKFDADAKVDMAFIDKNMTGREAIEAKSRDVSVEEYVSGVEGGDGAHAMRDRTARDALNEDFKDHATENNLKARAEVGAKKGQAPEVSKEDWDTQLEDVNTAFNDIAESQEYKTDGKSLKDAIDEEEASRAQQQELERQAQAERDKKAKEDLSQLMYSADPNYPKSGQPFVYSADNLEDDEPPIQPMGKHDNDNSLGPAFVPGNRPGAVENNNNAPSDDKVVYKYFQTADDEDSSEVDAMDAQTRSKYFQPVGEDDELAYVEEDFELSEQPAEFDASGSKHEGEGSESDAIDLEDIQVEGYATDAFDPTQDEDSSQTEATAPSDGYVDPDLEDNTIPSDGYVDPDLEDDGIPSDGYVDPDLEDDTIPSDGYVDPDLEDHTIPSDGYVDPDLDTK